MIEIIEGFGVGSGKTYYTVKRLLEHWRKGGTAYILDTMSINWPECKKFVERRHGLLLEDSQLNMVTEDQVTLLYEHTPPGTEDCPLLIVIDECQGSLNARDWADKSKRKLFDWCTQSRHDCNDLWFISQSALNVDKQLRRLATYVWRIRNTATWGKNIITLMCKLMKFMSFGIHSGAFFIVSQLDQDNRTLIGRKQWVDQDTEIFRCYNSRAMYGKRKRSGEAVCRLKLAKKQVKRPYVRWAVACCLISLGIVGCQKVKHIFHKEQAKETAKAQATATPAAPGYELRVETFRSQVSPNTLKTDKYFYQAGEMCPDGMVEVVKGNVARVIKPNREYLFILANRDGFTPAPIKTVQTQPVVTPAAQKSAKKP